MSPPSPHPHQACPPNQHLTICSQSPNVSPSTVALAPNVAPDPDLDARWAKISATLTTVLNGMQQHPDGPHTLKTPPQCWVEIYSSIATLYSEDDDTRKKRMFQNIRQFINEHVTSQLSCLRRFTGEELLAEYVRRWRISFEFARFMKRTLHHVQRYWIWDNANTLKEDPVRPLDHLLMFYWREHLLTYMPSFVDVALNLVDDDRRGIPVRRHLIRGLVDNLLTIGSADVFSSPDNSDSGAMQQRPHTHSTLYLYQQLFEEPFIAATTNFYERDGRVIVNSSDVRTFVRDISASLSYEDDRAAALLHPTSLPAVRRAAEEQLIGSHCTYLQDRAKAMIETGNETNLSLVYNLLTRVDGGLIPVRNFFTAFVRGQGNAIVIRHISNLKGSTDIRRSLCLIDRLICLYLRYAGLVRRCLAASNDFKLSIYDAFRGFVNRSIGQVSLPVLLAHFADQVFRTKKAPVAFSKAINELNTSASVKPAISTTSEQHDGSTDGGAPSEDSFHAPVVEVNEIESLDETSDSAGARVHPSHDTQKVSTLDKSVPLSNLQGLPDEPDSRSYRDDAVDEDGIRPVSKNEHVSSEPNTIGESTKLINTQATAHGMQTPILKRRRSTDVPNSNKNVQDEEMSLRCLSEVVRFFMFLEEKDSFFETHHMLFSKRLLLSYDETLERQFITELEEQMGAMYTHRLRGMLRDIMTTGVLRKEFSLYLKELKKIEGVQIKEKNQSNGSKRSRTHQGEGEHTDKVDVFAEHSTADGDERPSQRRKCTPSTKIGTQPSQDDATGPDSVPAPGSTTTNQADGRTTQEAVLDADAATRIGFSHNPPGNAVHLPDSGSLVQGPSRTAVAENSEAVNNILQVNQQTQAFLETEQTQELQQDAPQGNQQQQSDRSQQESPVNLVSGQGQNPVTSGNANNSDAVKKPSIGETELTAGRLARSLDFNTHVLNTLHWPGVGDGCVGLRMPLAVKKCEGLYEKFYMAERESRKLTWVHGMASAQISANFGGKGVGRKGKERCYTLCVSALQMTVLMALNGQDGRGIAVGELVKKLGVGAEEIQKAVRPLVLGRKFQVLRSVEGSGSKDMGEKGGKGEDQVERIGVNEEFESSSVRILVPSAVTCVDRVDSAGARRVAVVDRNTLIDAAVVRVMKERKEVSFVELCSEVIKQVSGSVVSVDSRTIKPRVERLIDMEYVERDRNDSKVYRYCA